MWVRGLSSLLMLLVAPAVASAQECLPPPPDLYPADGAPNVPVNGLVKVVFHQDYTPEQPLAQVLRLFDDDTGSEVSGLVSLDTEHGDTTVRLDTDELLQQSTQYRAVVLLPDTAGEQEFFFRTGQGIVDTSAPTFSGAREIRVVPADNVACAEPTGPVPPEEQDLEVDGRGFRVTVSFPPADDEAGAANIDYLLVQTSGPTIDEPFLRKRVRAAGTDDLFGAVFLPRAAVAREEICFEVHAEDMFGNRAEPGRDACGDPIGPGYFRSICSVGAVGGPASPFAALAGGLAALTLGRRRSRRRTSRRPAP